MNGPFAAKAGPRSRDRAIESITHILGPWITWQIWLNGSYKRTYMCYMQTDRRVVLWQKLYDHWHFRVYEPIDDTRKSQWVIKLRGSPGFGLPYFLQRPPYLSRMSRCRKRVFQQYFGGQRQNGVTRKVYVTNYFSCVSTNVKMMKGEIIIVISICVFHVFTSVCRYIPAE